MAGHRRRELAESFRLFWREERWFLLDLFLATVGYAAWAFGSTEALVRGFAAAGIDPGLATTARPTLVVGAYLVCWLLLPALAATWHLRRRVTNTSGNVERHYRFDAPATLLAPPAVVVAVGAVATVAAPLTWPGLALAFVGGAFLLVRTAAYSYRVYSFSYPGLVTLATFVTALAYATAGVVQFAAVTGSRDLIRDAVAVLGLPPLAYATIGSDPFAFPVVLAAAAAVPVALVGVYLAVQSLVAAYVRRAEPTVDRGAMRAGQRNPFQAVAASGGGIARRSPSTGDTDGDEVSVPAHVQTTRVYAPDGDVEDPTGTETDATKRGGQRCRTCGAGFGPDTEIRFCPNCGERLDDG